MSKNSERINHNLDENQNNFRASNGKQVFNDIAEELEGLGFSEPTYLAPPKAVFVDKITVWDSMAKTKKRAELTLNYGSSFPFIESVTKSIYNEDGTAINSTVTIALNYNANNTMQNNLNTSSRS